MTRGEAVWLENRSLADHADDIRATTTIGRAFRNWTLEFLDRAAGTSGGEEEDGGEDKFFHVFRVRKRMRFVCDAQEMF
jgi:hypothetical protein